MKIYYLDSTLTFGKFGGLTVEEIIRMDPDYINWCIMFLDHFLIYEQDLEEFKKINPAFALPKEGYEKLERKWNAHERNEMSRYEAAQDDWDGDIQTYDEWLNDEFGDDAGTAHWNLE